MSLRGLPLTNLDLKWNPQITDIGIQALRGLPLQFLDLNGALQITDEGLKGLLGMSLTFLDLGGCQQVTDLGLECIRVAPLTALNLTKCDAITDRGIVTLISQGMPLRKLRLGRDRGVPIGLRRKGIVVSWMAYPAVIRQFSSHPHGF